MADIERFGAIDDGSEVHVYTLACGDVTARVMDFGATLLSLVAPDQNGHLDDLVLGFDRLEGYFDNPACYGATIGPSANRTDRGEVTIAGTTYHMVGNDGPSLRNNLHTDLAQGIHKRIWHADPSEDGASVCFSLELPDGEYGLPGNRLLTAIYSLAPDESGAVTLKVHYECTSDAPTFVNMTNHTYWNLAGHASGSVLEQVVSVQAQSYLPLRDDNVSSGTVDSVADTPFDFRHPKALGRDIEQTCDQLLQAHGYDHCFCVDGYRPSEPVRPALHAEDPASGRVLDISITTPGAHLYTGNWLDDTNAKAGAEYRPRYGFAFEPEYWPDNMHHDDWVHPCCEPGHPYAQTILYRFSHK